MKARSVIFAAFALLALGGCATIAADSQAARCTTMECVAIGQAMTAGSVTVVPREVLEDSRCPADAQCVWAGRVRVSVDVTSRDEAQDEFTYRVTLASNEPVGLFGGMLHLAEVAPAPARAGEAIAPADYRFGFTFAPAVMDQPATLAR